MSLLPFHDVPFEMTEAFYPLFASICHSPVGMRLVRIKQLANVAVGSQALTNNGEKSFSRCPTSLASSGIREYFNSQSPSTLWFIYSPSRSPAPPSTMLFTSAFAVVALLGGASAHFQLQFPTPRGPFNMQNEPTFCGTSCTSVHCRPHTHLSFRRLHDVGF